MDVIDLSPQDEQLYFRCLEDWSEEMAEAGDHKEHWYHQTKDKGLRVKLARDDKGKVGGMIQYLPIEYSTAKGRDLYFILCIWVHGYREGRGNFQHHGMGRALIRAAEEDARMLGAKGIAAWGISMPFFMRASWFRKQGYRTADKMNGTVLLWKSFTSDAETPVWIRQKKKPEQNQGKVTISVFVNGWCPAQNLTFERARRAVEGYGDDVLLREYHTADREVFLEWGISDALYIDGRRVNTGPPPSYKKIRRIIDRRLRRLHKPGA